MLLPAIVFCLSFTVVFVALGMTATGLGSTLQDGRGTLDKAAGVVIIAARGAVRDHAVRAQAQPRVAAGRADLPRGLGRAADRRRRVRVRVDALRGADARHDPHRRFGAGHRRPGRRAAALLLAGLAVPFLITAVAFTRATAAFRWLRDRYLIITALSGAVLIAMGLLLITGELTALNLKAQQALDGLGLNFFNEL